MSARGPLRVDGVGGSPAFVYEARGSFKRLYAVGKQRRCTNLECVATLAHHRSAAKKKAQRRVRPKHLALNKPFELHTTAEEVASLAHQ